MNPALIAEPSRALIQSLIQQSKAFPAMGDFELQFDSEQTFAVTILRDEQIIAGAIGAVACDWAFLETVWVDDSLRGQGVGRRLMKAVESYVLQLGMNGILLYTVDFQAPEFYPKLGYNIIGKLPDRPQGQSATYFSKTALEAGHLTSDFHVENPVTQATFDYLETGIEQHATAYEPFDVAECVFVLKDNYDDISGGLFGHHFWGWLDVHLCYAATSYGVNQLLDSLERYCKEAGLGIVLPAYEDWQCELLEMQGYHLFATLPDRPTGKTTTIWVCPQPKI